LPPPPLSVTEVHSFLPAGVEVTLLASRLPARVRVISFFFSRYACEAR
jgi:hypothetical protein